MTVKQIVAYFADFYEDFRPEVAYEMLQRLGISPEEIAYIGDDLNDLDCIRACGFTACPADAVPEVLKAVDYVCKKEGGRGAVREFIAEIRAQMDSTV